MTQQQQLENYMERRAHMATAPHYRVYAWQPAQALLKCPVASEFRSLKNTLAGVLVSNARLAYQFKPIAPHPDEQERPLR